jgi:hypothetical protein
MQFLTREKGGRDDRSSLILTIVLTIAQGVLPARAVAEGARPALEPSVAELQAAAIRLAGVEAERGHSLTRRSRRAGAVPHLRLRFGRGNIGYLRGLDGVDRYVATNTDEWHVEAEAAWSLDRLVFDHNEGIASREAQRLAVRRQELIHEVTRLYFARERAKLALARAPDEAERALALDELSAELDALTGGALAGQGGGTPCPSQSQCH